MAPETRPSGEAAALDTQVRLWRRQLVLVGLSAVVFIAAVGLLMVTLGLTANREAEVVRANPDSWRVETGITLLSWQMWPALVGLAAVATVLTVTVVHTVRVAAFAFRKGDDL